MHAPDPGHHWKTPFLWEPGCLLPPETTSGLSFQPVEQAWLESALAEVMTHTPDESNLFCVAKYGSRKAALDLLAACGPIFDRPLGWWQSAVDSSGQQLGFVLPVLFKDPSRFKEGRPQGTILHIGVLPEYRRQGIGSCVAAPSHAYLHRSRVLAHLLRYRLVQHSYAQRVPQGRLHGAKAMAAASGVVLPNPSSQADMCRPAARAGAGWPNPSVEPSLNSCACKPS